MDLAFPFIVDLSDEYTPIYISRNRTQPTPQLHSIPFPAFKFCDSISNSMSSSFYAQYGPSARFLGQGLTQVAPGKAQSSPAKRQKRARRTPSPSSGTPYKPCKPSRYAQFGPSARFLAEGLTQVESGKAQPSPAKRQKSALRAFENFYPPEGTYFSGDASEEKVGQLRMLSPNGKVVITQPDAKACSLSVPVHRSGTQNVCLSTFFFGPALRKSVFVNVAVYVNNLKIVHFKGNGSQHNGHRITEIPAFVSGRQACFTFQNDTLKYSHGKTTTVRSEEHTSELQSPDHLVCRLLLEKKNKTTTNKQTNKPQANKHNYNNNTLPTQRTHL